MLGPQNRPQIPMIWCLSFRSFFYTFKYIISLYIYVSTYVNTFPQHSWLSLFMDFIFVNLSASSKYICNPKSLLMSLSLSFMVQSGMSPRVTQSACVFPVEAELSDNVPSYFSFCTVNNCLFLVVYSVWWWVPCLKRLQAQSGSS